MYFTDYYIPLVNTMVDVDRLKNEIDNFIRINYSLPEKARGFSITTSKEYVDDPFFNFRKHQTTSKPDEYGIRRLPDGKVDSDITLWPKILARSYMKELAYLFNDILKLENPRVRMSVTNGPYSLASHYDEHTPYRVHICLQTGPDTNWVFEDRAGNKKIIHQPRSSTPVLINTGSVKHGLEIPDGVQRIHFWYQYHKPVSRDIIQKLQKDISERSTLC